MIKEVDKLEIKDTSRRGPKSDSVEAAQRAVDEFLESGLDACEVDWSDIGDDFDKAKRCISYRIGHTRDRGVDGAEDLAFRSNREKAKIYLIHKDRISE